MALSSGTKLGPYEIQSPIGAGGMGEVYRARDTRLDRTVAIKILASHLSSSPELKQRMEREARAISSLNHVGICHLYDVGSQAGTDYLVMEFLEGETLAERLRKGPMPLNETTSPSDPLILLRFPDDEGRKHCPNQEDSKSATIQLAPAIRKVRTHSDQFPCASGWAITRGIQTSIPNSASISVIRRVASRA